MAKFQMDAYEHPDGRVFAICRDGARVITHWGLKSDDRLQGGGPLRNTGDPDGALSALRASHEAAGYRPVGMRTIQDGVYLQGPTPPPAAMSAPALSVSIAASHDLAALFKDSGCDFDAVRLGWTLPDGRWLALRPAGKLNVLVLQRAHGAVGLLIALALGRLAGARIDNVDSMPTEFGAICAEPALVGDTPIEVLRSMAERLGLVQMRLKFKCDPREVLRKRGRNGIQA